LFFCQSHAGILIECAGESSLKPAWQGSNYRSAEHPFGAPTLARLLSNLHPSAAQFMRGDFRLCSLCAAGFGDLLGNSCFARWHALCIKQFIQNRRAFAPGRKTKT
jgi:hypothetical protein